MPAIRPFLDHGRPVRVVSPSELSRSAMAWYDSPFDRIEWIVGSRNSIAFRADSRLAIRAACRPHKPLGTALFPTIPMARPINRWRDASQSQGWVLHFGPWSRSNLLLEMRPD